MDAKLATARAQLEEALEFLQTEPDNEELKILVQDLREAVSLAEALSASEKSASDDGPLSSGWVTTSSSSNAAKSAKGNSPALAEGLELFAGQRCEIKPKDGKRWQAGVVVRRLPDYEYVVDRLFDNQHFKVKGTDEIREIASQSAPLRHELLTPGLKVVAKYSGDGKYYQAVVEKRTDQGCMVRFEGYEDDEPEHVALEQVRLPEVGEAPPLRSVVEIPPHLVVQPDDSEEVKSTKLRKQKQLKRQAKQASVEQLHNHKQTNWMSFQATSKRQKGTLTTIGGASLFSKSGDL